MPEQSPSSIGSMNGPWALMLKAALATFPFIIGMGVWITASIFEMKTVVYGAAKEREYLRERISDMRDDFSELRGEFRDLKKTIETTNRISQNR